MSVRTARVVMGAVVTSLSVRNVIEHAPSVCLPPHTSGQWPSSRSVADDPPRPADRFDCVRERTEDRGIEGDITSTSGLEYSGPPCWTKANMLYTVAVVLVILWALGLVTSYTLGGLIHLLLVIALIAFLLQAVGGRRAL